MTRRIVSILHSWLRQKRMMNSRDIWASSDHSAILAQVHSELWRFIRHSATVAPSEVVTHLTGLTALDLETLWAIHYLLDPRTRGFLDAASAIMQRLSRTGLRQSSVSREMIRGRIDWPATVRERGAAGGDPNLYVVVGNRRSFDLHENRVLKFLLRNVLLLSQRVCRGLSEGTQGCGCIQPDSRSTWKAQVEALGIRAAQHLKSVHLRAVADLPSISERDLERVRRVRGHFYRELETAARQYVEAQAQPQQYLAEMLAQRVLEPLRRDDLYELWVLFQSINLLEKQGWKRLEIGLIGSDRGFSAVFQRGAQRIRFHFQQLPKPLHEASEYRDLMDKYGLGPSVRRPDIIIEREGGQPGYLIIEVKRSQSRSYIADGAYKLIGYLSDFAKGLQTSGPTQGILVVWAGPLYKPEMAGDRLVLASYHSYAQVFQDAVTAWLPLAQQ